MQEEGYKQLATAIVMMWVKDYKALIYKYLNCKDREKKKKILNEIKEMKSYAYTDWFRLLGMKRADFILSLIKKDLIKDRTKRTRNNARREQRGTY